MKIEKAIPILVAMAILFTVIISCNDVTGKNKLTQNPPNTMQTELKKMVVEDMDHQDVKASFVNKSYYRVRIYNYKIDTSKIIDIKEIADKLAERIQEIKMTNELKAKRFEIEFTESENPNIPDKFILNFKYSFLKDI